MILKVEKIWANLGLNYSFTMKRDFSGKLTTITFVYLVSPTILQNLKQIVRGDNLMYRCIILAQIRSSCLFTPKYNFCQSWLLLLSTYCILSCYNVSKKSSESKSWDRTWHNFGLIWVRVTSSKANLLEKLTNIALV